MFDVEPVGPVWCCLLLQGHPLLEVLCQLGIVTKPFEITELRVHCELERCVFGGFGELVAIVAEEFRGSCGTEVANIEAKRPRIS